MNILDGIIGTLLALWLGGLLFKISGWLIHLLLVLAIIILVLRLIGVNA